VEIREKGEFERRVDVSLKVNEIQISGRQLSVCSPTRTPPFLNTVPGRQGRQKIIPQKNAE